jgi:hypothetical protein
VLLLVILKICVLIWRTLIVAKSPANNLGSQWRQFLSLVFAQNRRLTLKPPFTAGPAKENRVTSEPYDYIICGGGTAGCVLAERLSADGTKRILVLEAGRPDYDYIFIRIPAGILRLFRSVYDWQHESKGEKACNGRNIFLQRGKVSLCCMRLLLGTCVD